MFDNIKVINFLQDFECVTLRQLQILFNRKNNNFNSLLNNNMISKKGNIFVHNTRGINKKMLAAIDVLCKYKGKFSKFYKGYYPIFITFFVKNTMYHIIVSDEEDQKGVVKLLNLYPSTLPKADKLILLFKNKEEYNNITCEIEFLYCIYPGLEIINIDN